MSLGLSAQTIDPSRLAPAPQVTWDRDRAGEVLATVDVDPVVDQLYQMTVAGAESALLETLERTRQRPDWPEPARDLAIYEFTRNLGALPADSVPPTVIAYLQAYPATTWVPHDDHPQGLVPLFNVRAAAAGLTHQWQREAALLEGLALLRSNPRGLIDAFAIEIEPSVHAGYLQALEQATPDQLGALSADARNRIQADPTLTPLAGRAALRVRDLPTLEAALRHGAGDAVHRLLHDAAAVLPRSDRLDLLQRTLGSGRGDAANLAIAALYPDLAGEDAADEALIARLGDPDLGAGAALALARSPSLATRQTLEALAATRDRPASRRARLALQLLDERLLEGTR
ncbi:MAG: hypothetical protein V2I57_16020 [Xanthomonadales bacterium]|jgi:hypothetical protein|nr:hypothetical protein [Xanthomonadales bacterium]